MDTPEAERLLAEAAADYLETKASADKKRDRLYDIIRTVAPALRQVDIVNATGWTREHIRRIVDGRQ